MRARKMTEWRAHDGSTIAFIGADGRLVLMRGMEWEYLYPNGKDDYRQAESAAQASADHD